jgi:hypothetical protein
MQFGLSGRRCAALAWCLAQACATYDGLQDGSSSAAGSAGAANGGHAGATGGTSTDGGTTSGSSGSDAQAGSAGTTGGAQSSGGSSEAGAATDAGAATAGGESGAGAAQGGASGASGQAAGGAGGAAAECLSAAPDVGCDCQLYAAHDYWFCSSYLSFTASENKCKSVGMHLPKIETQAEDAWLYAMAQSHSLGEYYLGSTDAATPNEWSWLAGGKLWSGVADGTAYGYTHFSANEPNASGDCLVVQSNGPWDDRGCTDQRRYVCESL